MNKKAKKFLFYTALIILAFGFVTHKISHYKYGIASYMFSIKVNPEKYTAENVTVLSIGHKYYTKSKYPDYFPIMRINGETVEPILHGLDTLMRNPNIQPVFISDLTYYKLSHNRIIIEEMTYKDSQSNLLTFVNSYKNNHSNHIISEFNRSVVNDRLFSYLILFIFMARLYYSIYLKKSNH